MPIHTYTHAHTRTRDNAISADLQRTARLLLRFHAAAALRQPPTTDRLTDRPDGEERFGARDEPRTQPDWIDSMKARLSDRMPLSERRRYERPQFQDTLF